ncbi:microfibril-associated glycoprotein 4-like [Conger conger]|nr:microfibril-associated glycoprotein 4-like [Conger conger]XP_061078876.1 microfibril-associated glycoprotein 4-like [Conger conger]
MRVSVFLLLPLSVAGFILPVPRPEDCDDVFRNGSIHSGVYTVYPRGYNQAVQVYCEMDCENDEHKGGWMVLQRRMDGTVNFYRPWAHYKTGFGNISGEHWLGLEHIFAITWQKKYMLKVEMEDFEGGNVHACYTSFSIDTESEGYRLHLGKYIDGGAGNALIYSVGSSFSTFDHGPYSYYAEKYQGGFWLNYYPYANPNGLYKWGRHSTSSTGVLWSFWKSKYYSLKAITMKVRPVSLEDLTGQASLNLQTSFPFY